MTAGYVTGNTPCLEGKYCANFQQCNMVGSTPTCQCKTGWKDFPTCLTPTTCATKLWSCNNYQNCIMSSDWPTCVCKTGWTGEDCKQLIPIDFTASTICDLQCENDGQCMSTTSGKRCECQPGWTGTLCNQRVCEAGFAGPNCKSRIVKSNAKTPALSILFLAIFVILK